MSKNDTRPIGEIFEYHRIKFQVVENETCKGCYFHQRNICINISKKTGDCGSSVRNDRKSVIFKRIIE